MYEYIYCLARRLKTIVSENYQLMKRMEVLKQDLIERKYPLLLIQDGISKALQKTKEELRNVKEKNKQRNIPFVTTFNPNNPELFGIISQNRRILGKSKVIKSIKKQTPLLKEQKTAS